MDALTHIFLPLTAFYVLKREAFQPPYLLALGLFGILPDLDKLLGMPGLLHSLLTLIPLAVVAYLAERSTRGTATYSSAISLLVFSHLLLDLLDGGPVTFLYPLTKTGVGLEFPLVVTFHSFGFSFHNALVKLVYGIPEPGFNSYGTFSGFGVASLFLFALIYLGTSSNRKLFEPWEHP